MRILFVITSTDTGGAEKALADLALVLHPTHQIRVLSLKPLGSVAQMLIRAGVEVKPILSRWPGKSIQFIRKEIISFQPDIVHAMLFRAIEYTRIACAGLPVKVLTTPHYDLSKKSFFCRFIDGMLHKRDTLTVAESLSTANYLVQMQGYAKDKVYFLPNGVDKTKFFKDAVLRKTMRDKYSFHVKTVVFISIARLADVKDPLTTLKAFRNVWHRNKDTRLIYVGEGEMRAKLEAYIQTCGMQEAVLLLGEQEDINSLLNMADVFVLSSKEESLPLALLEALQVGLPCLVTRVGDMPRWVEHGQNGFVFSVGDITVLSCLMNLLADEAKMREAMSEKSLATADKIVVPAQGYQQIYQQVISN